MQQGQRLLDIHRIEAACCIDRPWFFLSVPTHAMGEVVKTTTAKVSSARKLTKFFRTTPYAPQTSTPLALPKQHKVRTWRFLPSLHSAHCSNGLATRCGQGQALLNRTHGLATLALEAIAFLKGTASSLGNTSCCLLSLTLEGSRHSRKSQAAPMTASNQIPSHCSEAPCS